MSRKHNTKHRRSQSSYPKKVAVQGKDAYPDYKLADGRPVSAKR